MDKKCDVFAFAVILWEMFARRKPWIGKNGKGLKLPEIKKRVLEGERPAITDEMRAAHGELLNLVELGWSQVPLRRPTFSEIRVTLESHALNNKGG